MAQTAPPMQQQQMQPQMMPQPDPLMQALIEADFRPVDITLGEPNNACALCAEHSLEKCEDCDVDFVWLNRLSKTLAANPNLLCPPPPNLVNQKLSVAINNTKEEGNTFFRTRQYDKALGRYTQAANYACQRAPWELQQFMREELSTILSNRSAAFFEAGDIYSALTDADAVIQLKKPWSKGHFRKAKALIALGRVKEAKEAVQFGLQFDPQNAEMIGVLSDIDFVLRHTEQKSAPTAAPSEKAQTA